MFINLLPVVETTLVAVYALVNATDLMLVVGFTGFLLGSPLIDGIFLVQKMCIYSCVTLSTTLLIHAVQFNARSACDASMLHHVCIHDVNIDASQADRALNWTARINKVVDRVTQE